MPRPARVRDREASRASGAESIPAAVNDEAIDDTPEIEQSSRSGSVEDDDFIQSVAKRAGWSEEKERNGKPIKDWQDARTYLEKLPDVLHDRDERLRRTGQVAEAAAEEARTRALREAETRLSGAIDTGDKDAAREAARDVGRNSGPHPATVSWMARNPWFRANGNPGDAKATALAVATIQEAEAEGKSIVDALAAGEAEVRRAFPHHFGSPAPRDEPRLSDRAPPAVAPGSRTPVARTKSERGWADIPSQDRGQMTQFVTKAVRRGQTAAQAQTFLANAYWKEKA